MSNIKDVAKLAGVSVSTVSNILNDKTSVSEELHQKVIKAMEELDYHPNFLAINLRKKKISFIGVVLCGLTGHYHQILEGINRVAKENKCQPILKIVGLNKEDMKKIVSILIKDLQKRCEEQLQMELVVRDSAKIYIVEKAFDRKYGARPLKRKIQDEIEDKLAEDIIAGKIKAGDKVIVTIKKEAIFISK